MWKRRKQNENHEERMLTGDLYVPSLTEGLETYRLKGKTPAQQYNRWTSISKEDARC